MLDKPRTTCYNAERDMIQCARSPVDRTLASGAESVGSTPAERTIYM